jgi:hypothetical protein
MKHVALLLALTGSFLVATDLVARANQPSGPWLVGFDWSTNAILTLAASPRTQSIAAGVHGISVLNSNALLWPVHPVRTNSPVILFGFDKSRSPVGPIPPGLYQTAPYTALVLVPGPHPDDKCIAGMGGSGVGMPMIRPELRFIPKRTQTN